MPSPGLCVDALARSHVDIGRFARFGVGIRFVRAVRSAVRCSPFTSSRRSGPARIARRARPVTAAFIVLLVAGIGLTVAYVHTS
jgi:hypothetical protein